MTPNRRAVITDRVSSENLSRKISFTDPEMPPVGILVLKLLQQVARQPKLSLTQRQVNDLLSPVITTFRPEPYASPQEMYEKFPELFERFIFLIPNMPAWKHQTPTATGIIKMLRGYHYGLGWLHYMPRETVVEETPSYSLFDDLWEEENA